MEIGYLVPSEARGHGYPSPCHYRCVRFESHPYWRCWLRPNPSHDCEGVVCLESKHFHDEDRHCLALLLNYIADRIPHILVFP